MMKKQPVCPDRVRRIPNQFSWVDHRLVSEHYIDRLSPAGAALYLFLITVSDAQGMSYYGEASIAKRLNMPRQQLVDARQELTSSDLVAYKDPLYQVLPLDTPTMRSFSRQSSGYPESLREILKHLA